MPVSDSPRILSHPVIERFPKGLKVMFEFDGNSLEGFEGEPIAMALRANGITIHRYTPRGGSPRGVFCAIGRCTDCVMVVDGVPNVRTCVTPLQNGMTVQTQYGAGSKPKEIDDDEAV
jgi:predicted molibdopterin-dependent oxidoreductase YjgC